MTDATVAQRIKDDISSNDVVLYMKGTPVFPMCGFSPPSSRCSATWA